MKTADEQENEIKAYILEGARKLKAFCDENNVSVSAYQTPKPRLNIHQFRELAENDPELMGQFIDPHMSLDDPDILNALYRGYVAGLTIDDFNAYVKHVKSEVIKYRKIHKKGFKHFQIVRVHQLG